MTVDVFFDYTCGFSNRARHWLDALEDTELSWRPFSLLEQNARDDGPPVFERAEYDDNPSLIALAVHEQVRAHGGDLDAYRRRMFSAGDEEPGRLSTRDIVGFRQDAGLGLRDFDHAAGFAAVATQHTEATKLGERRESERRPSVCGALGAADFSQASWARRPPPNPGSPSSPASTPRGVDGPHRRRPRPSHRRRLRRHEHPCRRPHERRERWWLGRTA
jgi:hypothetical protein